jgi:phosphatidylglycerol:prolipoprotein diacylglycerol transferase
MKPLLFETISTFWIFFGIAMMSGTFTVIKLSKKNNLKLNFLSENSLKLIIFTIIGARIVNLTSNYKSYFYEFSFGSLIKIFYIWDKGLSAWGAIAAFLISIYFLAKKREQSFWKWFDILVPALIIILAITSLGGFFEGINYGRETSLPWGVNFESPTIKYTVPIHPTQIYAFLYSAIIAASLIILNHSIKTREKKIEGIVGMSGVIAYSILRFLEEFVRGDDTWIIFGIRSAQIITAIVIISSGIFLFLRYNMHELIPKKKK